MKNATLNRVRPCQHANVGCMLRKSACNKRSSKDPGSINLLSPTKGRDLRLFIILIFFYHPGFPLAAWRLFRAMTFPWFLPRAQAATLALVACDGHLVRSPKSATRAPLLLPHVTATRGVQNAPPPPKSIVLVGSLGSFQGLDSSLDRFGAPRLRLPGSTLILFAILARRWL